MSGRPIVDRAAILQSLGAGEAEVEELLRYTQRPSASAGELSGKALQLALPDEPFAETWRAYAAEAGAGGGAWPTLQRKLIQLSFPVSAGRSQEAAYQAATRQGVWPEPAAPGLALDQPAALTLQVQSTAAGALPFLYTPHRADFEKLVQALTRRNEPWPVPASMGACLVAGYNNWDRMAKLRAARQEEFASLAQHKALYQDTFLILSGGPYSAVSAASLGLTDPEWEQLSVAIRLEHECAHYVTRRFFGVLSRRLDEELLADFAGLAAAIGRYPATWALRFLGLEDFPRYRPGGRLENYRAVPPLPALSDGAFSILTRLTFQAVRQLEATLAAGDVDLAAPAERTFWLLALSHLTLEEMTSPAIGAWLNELRSEPG